MQVSARTVSHAVHATPLGPHVAGARGLQIAPVQQPAVQLAAHPLHAPLVQVSVPGQLWQAEPAAPQADAEVPG